MLFQQTNKSNIEENMLKLGSKMEQYLRDKDDLEEYYCQICFDIFTHPFKCAGPCHKTFCGLCVCQIKKVQDRCPNMCSQPLSVTKIEFPKAIKFICPYSPLCKTEINSSEEFHKHFKICSYVTEEENFQEILKLQYKCRKKHHLQFYVDRYTQMISTTCSGCLQKKICRSICRICSEKYCTECRVPPCSKKSCPLGHKFTKMEGKYLQEYLCDICGLEANVLNISIYDDKQCNYGICEYCYQGLPLDKDRSKMRRLINQNNCLCGGSLKPNKIASPSHKCSLCFKIKECPKQCGLCHKYYCLECKSIKIYEKSCEKGHQLMRITSENESCKKCMRCNKEQNQYYYDQQCKILLCVECTQYFFYLTFDKERLRRILCRQGHQLSYIRLSENLRENCTKCKNEKCIRLYCHKCDQNEGFYCSSCKFVPFNKCYFDHPMLPYKSKAENGMTECQVCWQQKSNVKYCKKCEFYVCQSCIKSSLLPAQPTICS